MSKIIKLAGQEHVIVAPAFGKLKKVIASIKKIQQFSSLIEGGTMSEEAMNEVSIILSLMTGKTIEEIDNMQIGISEIAAAMEIIPEICGLVLVDVKEGKSGEVKA